ncbi:class I SAM-dependent methyltransferase [Dickeya poaceiphila]|uniref:Class I SAM-dependent methyltransferase n=1 Tax=Dickeya poaceiphila TaxID=568768 RepID=A0A5B8I8M9_9GAMM|nr:class I SAM-dependent methyltransferase [Dickeya poaceiphila]QDX31102.1 class I SAM-dependent methyltransferase [Dickeya poaceiphila]
MKNTSLHSGQGQLLSHQLHSPDDHYATLNAVRTRIQQAGDLPGATVEEQIAIAEELATFELGQFLLAHRGLNAYWTHNLVTYPSATATLSSHSDLEKLIYERFPVVLVTRERFCIFRQQLQSRLYDGMVLASVPCGLMGDLLLLDYSHHQDVRLIGVDLDNQALEAAESLARQQHCDNRITLLQGDAWTLQLPEPVDVLTSNGLNIYEPDDDKVTDLYRVFNQALKPEGTLITSFLTPPPMLSAESPWRVTEEEQRLLPLQHLLFSRILEVKWTAFRIYSQTQHQLEQAGFCDIHFIDDRMRMYPTVIARKTKNVA